MDYIMYFKPHHLNNISTDFLTFLALSINFIISIDSHFHYNYNGTTLIEIGLKLVELFNIYFSNIILNPLSAAREKN